MNLQPLVLTSLDSGHELATISPDGVLTAEGWENGEIVVRATSALDNRVYATAAILKEGFQEKPNHMEIILGSSSELTPEQTSIALTAKVYPEHEFGFRS